MGRPVLSRVTTCGQWCGKVWLLNVCTQAQRGVYLYSIYIYLSVPRVRKQYLDVPLFHVYTWVIPPYFLKC